jgi:hypothetical protein
VAVAVTTASKKSFIATTVISSAITISCADNDNHPHDGHNIDNCLHDGHINMIIGKVEGAGTMMEQVAMSMKMVLSTIASKQAHGTKNRMQNTKQLLDNLATHTDATVQFHVPDMILNIHSDVLYLSKANAHAEHAGISSWEGIQSHSHTANHIEWVILPCAQYHALSSHPPLRQNLVHYF